jgi:hypothetical protein
VIVSWKAPLFGLISNRWIFRNGCVSIEHVSGDEHSAPLLYSATHYFFPTGTGIPAIFTLTEPNVFRVVKYSVFQSSPPKPILLVED